MRRENENVLMCFGLGYDDVHREKLKAKRYSKGRVQASLPVSIMEFQEIVDKYFVEWMNADERLGYSVLVGLLYGKSFDDLAKDLGKDVEKCRESVGKFGNMFHLTATNDLVAWLPSEVSSALKCEEKGVDGAVHNKRLPPVRHNLTGDCTTSLPLSPVTNVSGALADEVLKRMSKHPRVSKLVWWANSYGVESDEAFQEIMIAMWDALRTFDPRISPLEQFMIYCAKKRLANRVTRDRMIRRRLRETKFDEYRISTPPRRRTPDDKGLEDRKERVESMTAMEMKAVRERANGYSYKQIGSGAGFSDVKSVDNALYRVCRKMSAEGSGSPPA